MVGVTIQGIPICKRMKFYKNAFLSKPRKLKPVKSFQLCMYIVYGMLSACSTSSCFLICPSKVKGGASVAPDEDERPELLAKPREYKVKFSFPNPPPLNPPILGAYGETTSIRTYYSK